MTSIDQLKTQRAELDKQIAQLEQQTKANKIKDALAYLKTNGLTVDDLPKGRTAKASVGAKVPPKYRHTKTGKTWTGRGKQPTWFADAELLGEVERLC